MHAYISKEMKTFFKNFDLFGRKGVADRAREQDPDGTSVFNKEANPKAICREWTRSINREVRKIERDVDGMSRSEKTTVAEIKKLAEKKEFSSVKILAKELVFLRGSKERLMLSKVQLKSVANQLTQQMAVAKLGATFQQSAEIMASMNQLVNVPEIHEIISQLGKEMAQMGIIQAVVADGIDEALGDSLEMEEQTTIEVNKLLEELAIDAITLVPSANKQGLKVQKVSVSTNDKTLATEASP
jgi:division protein CdvB (Snf7/Vps24/ESCRT-III family)